MQTTYRVRVWSIQENVRKAKADGKPRRTYTVRWLVDARAWKATYETRALADSFRASLLTAARRGEAFVVDTGRPMSLARPDTVMSWYEFACEYVDMKWSGAAANSRRSTAEALVTVTVAMVRPGRDVRDARGLRTALRRWGFNTSKRGTTGCPRDVVEQLRWVETSVRPVTDLADHAVLRAVFEEIASKLDGSRCAATVLNRRRAVLFNTLEYAVERDLLTRNPMESFKWRAPKISHSVDRRSVVNPWQARTLLRALAEERPRGATSDSWQSSGPRLVAFFALLYFAALRPEEAVNLCQQSLRLPRDGWGEIHLEWATPDAGRDWTDSGRTRDLRQLKHRARGETRAVPCTPELTAILTSHLRTYGPVSGGRLFSGLRGGELSRVTYQRAWDRARQATFTREVYDSPLGRTPYTLRHACVSTWLNGGVPPTQVAEWAGHSVDVLLRVYAKCLDGQDVESRRRVVAALGGQAWR